MNRAATVGMCGIGLLLLGSITFACWPRDPLVARYQGGTIKRSELVNALERDYGEDTLQQLLTQRLIDQAIAAQGLKLSDVDLELWVADYKKRGDVQEVTAAGQFDEAKLREHLRTTVPLYYLALKDVDEKEREKYFEAHRSHFEQLELAHILLGSEEEAIRLRERITGPDSFATMAIVHSLDDRNRDFNGALGRVSRAELEESFSDKDVQSLFKVPLQHVSRPMQGASGGWHLFLVQGKATDYQSLKRLVVAEMAQPRLVKCLEELRDQAKVEILWTPPPALPQPSATPSSLPAGGTATMPAPSTAPAAAPMTSTAPTEAPMPAATPKQATSPTAATPSETPAAPMPTASANESATATP